MVYRGKPSPACEPCRKRRGKCDGKRPSCSQCIRKGIRCPGYRNLADLYFQDETDHVLRKHNTAKDRGRSRDTTGLSRGWENPLEVLIAGQQLGGSSDNAIFSVGDADLAAMSAESWVAFSTGSPAIFSSLPIKDHAGAFFINVYIPASPFNYLLEHYKSTVLFDAISSTPSSADPLPAAIQAASLASLSLTHPSPSITHTARTHYATALHLTNAALASRRMAARDSTLVAVLLLGLFETILFRGRASPTSWTAHTSGALALLRLRGPSQFSRPLGRDLFIQASNTINASCLMRGVAVPPAMRALYAAAPPELAEHPGVRLGVLLDRLAELRMAVAGRPGTRSPKAKPFSDRPIADKIAVLRAIADMEDAFACLELDMPSDWWSVVPPAEAPRHAFKGQAHRFINTPVARLFVTTRMSRLFLNEKLGPACERVLGANDRVAAHGKRLFSADVAVELQGMRDVAFERGEKLILDSLAAVPYFWDPDRLQPGKGMTRGGFGARMLLWPLTVVAQSELCSYEAREWTLDCLRKMSVGDTGFPQAAEAARMLEEGGLPEDWIHLWHVS